MESDETQICRLCLKVCKSGFETIGDDTRLVLNFVQLTLNLDVCHEPVICNVCLHRLKECSNFKVKSLRKRNLASNIHESIIFNPSDMPKMDDSALATETFDSNNVCYFCGTMMGSSVVTVEEIKSLICVMEAYLPEMEIKLTEEFLLCKPCCASLQSNYNFINNCLSTENKIKEYCEVGERNSDGQVDNILRFIAECESNNDIGSNFNAIKTEESEPFDCEAIIKVKNEDFLVLEEHELCEMKDTNVIKGELDDDDDRFEDTMRSSDPSEALAVVKDDGYLLSDENTQKKTLFKCSYCTFSTKHTDALLQHRECHKNASKTITYRCSLCSFHTVHVGQVQKHMITHQKPSSIYKCKVCTYKSNVRQHVLAHMAIHKKSSKAKVHKCEICAFQTKYKNCLSKHMLTHKSMSEVIVYKCDKCQFQSKYKASLRAHVLIHPSPSEVGMYKCEKCAFQTKRSSYLRLHRTRHMNFRNSTIYKSYETVSEQAFEETVGSLRSSEVLDVATNDDLERHGQIRNSVSENTEYRRERSTFDFDSKDNVSRQRSNESTPITQFKCSYCTFSTIYIGLLLQHMVGHMNASEITTYNCSLCSYRSKIIRNLYKHLTLHQKRTTMHECNICTYKTMYMKNLQHHALTHKTRSEVTMYKCTLCSFESKLKLSLNYHMLTHQNSSEVIIYKCEICGYHTKHKKNLGRHVLSHKNKKVRGVRVSEQTQAEHTTAHGP